MCPLCVLPILAYAHSSLIHHSILLGHFKLWELGFEHRDPSLANLMIDPETKCAVLNDWDLSYHPNFLKSVQPHGERTGTVPLLPWTYCAKEIGQGIDLVSIVTASRGSSGFYLGCSYSTRKQHSR